MHKKSGLASSCPSVLQCAWNNSAVTGRNFIKFDIYDSFENLSGKFKFRYNLTTITGTVHADRYTCLITSLSVLLRTRNVSDKSGTETLNTLTKNCLCVTHTVEHCYISLSSTVDILGRPRRRWVDNIRTDLQEVGCGCMDWIGLAQDRDRWRTLVSAVMSLRVP